MNRIVTNLLAAVTAVVLAGLATGCGTLTVPSYTAGPGKKRPAPGVPKLEGDGRQL